MESPNHSISLTNPTDAFRALVRGGEATSTKDNGALVRFFDVGIVSSDHRISFSFNHENGRNRGLPGNQAIGFAIEARLVRRG
jgi:hypothetical protein